MNIGLNLLIRFDYRIKFQLVQERGFFENLFTLI